MPRPITVPPRTRQTWTEMDRLTWVDPDFHPLPELTQIANDVLPLILINFRVFLKQLGLDLLKQEYMFRKMILQLRSDRTRSETKDQMVMRLYGLRNIFCQFRGILNLYEGQTLRDFIHSNKVNLYWNGPELQRLDDLTAAIPRQELESTLHLLQSRILRAQIAPSGQIDDTTPLPFPVSGRGSVSQDYPLSTFLVSINQQLGRHHRMLSTPATVRPHPCDVTH